MGDCSYSIGCQDALEYTGPALARGCNGSKTIVLLCWNRFSNKKCQFLDKLHLKSLVDFLDCRTT